MEHYTPSGINELSYNFRETGNKTNNTAHIDIINAKTSYIKALTEINYQLYKYEKYLILIIFN